MIRRKHNSTDNIYYKPLSTNDNEDIDSLDSDQTDGFMKEFVKIPQKKSPWKTIAFIVFFLVAGTTCLISSFLIGTGHIGQKHDDRVWPLFILGILMFIPGGYYSYILSSILLKRDGFTIDDIPTM